MADITNNLKAVNSEPNNVPVEWYQHTRLLLSLNPMNDDGTPRVAAAADFSVASCVSNVEYERGDLREVTEPLVPQPTFVAPTLIESGRPTQVYLSIPHDMYLEDVAFSTTTRPAVVSDVLYTGPTGETDLLRFTIIVFSAKGSI